MYRRVYFLVPDKIRALAVIEDLACMGIDRRFIETLADPRTSTDGLPQAGTVKQKRTGDRLEKFFRNSNLISFIMAFGCLIYLLITRNFNWWLFLPPAVMAANFITGLNINFDNTHTILRGEFREALDQGEILLLVEIPENHAADIEQRVHIHHPETASGAVTWGSEAYGH